MTVSKVGAIAAGLGAEAADQLENVLEAAIAVEREELKTES